MTKLEWFFDYYVAYYMFNGMKRNSYEKYMRRKWKDKYIKK